MSQTAYLPIFHVGCMPDTASQVHSGLIEQQGGIPLMSVVNEWAFIGVFMAVSWIFPTLPIVVARFFAPSKPNAIKMQTYECGVETVGDTWVQFKAQYYIYGLIFLVFDVEMIFLFPWAMAYNQLDFFAFGAGLLFIFLLTDGLVYAWRKGALEWQ
jgi:NADH:ubiquinone oxidoreductase subunit 3 (subunit A)